MVVLVALWLATGIAHAQKRQGTVRIAFVDPLFERG